MLDRTMSHRQSFVAGKRDSAAARAKVPIAEAGPGTQRAWTDTVSEPATAPQAAAPPAAESSGWLLPLGVVVIGMFMSVLYTSIVNVAIPTIQGVFGASPDDIEWIATAYTLCLGVVVPTSAWLGERLGLRRTYLAALLLFAVFSAMCGTASDLSAMIVYRILQAIPGGGIPVTCLTILYRMVPPSTLGAAMGLYGLGLVFAPGVGPTLGGYLVDYVNWRLIFYINVPIGVLGAIAAIVVLPKFPPGPKRRFDMPGFLCIAIACFTLLLAVSEGQQRGWTGYRVLILVAVGLDLLALFVVVELHAREPLLNLQVFRHWPFVNSLVLMGIVYTGMFSTIYLIPPFLQNVQGITAWNTGLTVMPQALVMGVLTPISGRLFDKIGAQYLVMAGMTIYGLASLSLVGLNIDMGRRAIVMRLLVSAAGLSLCFMPIMTGGLSALPPSIVSAGSAVTTLVQRVVAALGLAALTALISTQQAQLFADRVALISGNAPAADSRISQMEGKGPGELIPLFTELRHEISAQSYSDAFLLVGMCVLATMPLAFLLPKRVAGGAAPVEF